MSSPNDNSHSNAPLTFDDDANKIKGGISLTTGYEDDDETTRRVGSFNPNFGGFGAAPGATAFMQPMTMQATIQTVNPKAAAIATSSIRPPPAPTSIWSLKQVPTLPEFHPLERTAVFVPRSDPAEVAARICDVLRDRSIEATYDSEKAKVKCVTVDGVDFRIRLYRGRNSYSHGIIVEVQRRFGTSVTFHKDTIAILDAAEGKTPPPPPPSFGNNIPMVSDVEDDFEVSGSSSLEMVSKMFSHGYDSHYLAFQTLIPLTDPVKMGLKTARAVSKELLKDGNDVGSRVRSLVLAKKDEEDMFKLRSMAMTVLANAIRATKGEIGSDFREQLRPVLVLELQNANKNPRSAQLAAQCIEFLIDSDHNVDELCDVLEQAEEVGKTRHAGLKAQVQKCLKKINGGSR